MIDLIKRIGVYNLKSGVIRSAGVLRPALRMTPLLTDDSSKVCFLKD